jgi:chromosome segregation ATPase
MSDQPLTIIALAQFHRQVILPDIERIVGSAVHGAETRLRDEMHTLHDAVLKRLDHLDIEYEMLKAGLRRVEERLESSEARLETVEARLDTIDTRLDTIDTRLDTIDARLDTIEARLGNVDERLEKVEGRLDHLEAMVLELRTRLGRVEERLEEMIAVEEKYPLRVEVQDLKARVERLHEDVRRLERRIKPSAKG